MAWRYRRRTGGRQFHARVLFTETHCIQWMCDELVPWWYHEVEVDAERS